MAKQTVVTHLEEIEELAPLLDKLPVRSYTLENATSSDFQKVLGSILSHLTDSEEASFIVVMSKKTFIREEREKTVGKLLTGAGIKAEPVFVVVGKSFQWSEIDRIVQCNHHFYLLPKDSLLSRKNVNAFRGLIDKALFDYQKNRRLIDLISNEFLSFIEKEKLRSSKEEIEQLNMELESQNKIDELTKLLNRKGIIEYFQMAKGRATRERWRIKIKSKSEEDASFKDKIESGDLEQYFGKLSCMMIDIDDFKKVNDRYGHLAGDMVLKELGRLFNNNSIFRSEDVSGRYGGEEFIVILPATSAKNAWHPAEKLRKSIGDKEFDAGEGKTFHVTISVGIGELDDSEESIDEIIKKADVALYRAKETGKDKTVIYSSSPEGAVTPNP